MSKKISTWYILKQLAKRGSEEPMPEERRFLRVLWVCFGCFLLFPCLLFSTNFAPLFGWLLYASAILAIVVEVALLIWRIQDIVKQSRANEREE